MLLLAIALAVSDAPTAPLVDVVELNTLYRPDGTDYVVGLQQVILWRWTADGLRVAEWQTAADFRVESGRAYWTHAGKLYSCRYKSKRETHTLSDPEVEDRQHLAPERRRAYFR